MNEPRGASFHKRIVVQIAAKLRTENSTVSEAYSKAINSSLDWLRYKQRLNIPNEAYLGQSFELDIAEGEPVSVVRVGDYWAAQFDKLAADVPGRIWRTEISIVQSGTEARVGIRLSLLDRHADTDYEASIPSVVGDIIRSPGMADYGIELTDIASVIRNENDFHQFISLVENPHRNRPVVAFSYLGSESIFAEAAAAARRLAGVAHVFVFPDIFEAKLAEAFGEEFSLRNEAIRTYMPGFDPAMDEVMAHPIATRLWLMRRFRSMNGFYSALLRSFTNLTSRQIPNLGIPAIKEVRQAYLQWQLSRLDTGERSDREAILEKEILLYQQRIEEKDLEYDYADSEVKKLEEERDRYRAQLISLKKRIDFLEDQIGEERLEIDYPDSFDSLEGWIACHFPGRLILLNRAARAAKKSVYNDPKLIYRCLERLAKDYVECRQKGQPVDSLFGELGVKLERTGDETRLRRWESEYFVTHKGRRCFFEWHLKKGSDHNEANTMRIYFFYDEDDETVVIGHLTGHLTNEKT